MQDVTQLGSSPVNDYLIIESFKGQKVQPDKVEYSSSVTLQADYVKVKQAAQEAALGTFIIIIVIPLFLMILGVVFWMGGNWRENKLSQKK